MIPFSCPPPLNDKGFRLMPECGEDATFLRAYFIAEHWPVVEPLPWDDMQKKCLLAQQFEFQHKSYDAAFPNSAPLVLKKNNTPVGRLYLAVDRIGLHVVDILLAQNWLGHGIGKALMQWVQSTAKYHHLPVVLSVDKLNGYAGFYRKLGFVISGSDDLLWTMRWPPAPTDISAPHPRDDGHAFRPLSRYADVRSAIEHNRRGAEY